MKQTIFAAAALLLTLTACDDFLDREPRAAMSPESYFADAAQLQAYADKYYNAVLPGSSGNSYGFYAGDEGTDNQVSGSAPSRFCTGEWKTSTSGGDWSFSNIYYLNYFFANVNPRFGADMSGAESTISGDRQAVRHFIGEMHMLRALEYFKRYKAFGDYPIITQPLKDDMDVLTEASKRSPRNEVARFILADLDSAITLMDGKEYATTRLGRDAALLVKSRVALFEGTWLKYFAGTAFVPQGQGWPGKEKDYAANYQYPTGSVEAESKWMLQQAMDAAKQVADKYKASLTPNSGVLKQDAATAENPYFAMFASESLTACKEVLLWRQYVSGLAHNDMALAANGGNWGVGLTRGYVQNFLMLDGKPVYAHGSYADGDGYNMGDKTIADVRQNRDQRLALFLKEPGQKNVITESQTGITNITLTEPYPDIINGASQYAYTTGYALRKAGAWDSKYLNQNKGYLALAVYRAPEALLNYMEAEYELNGSLDATARDYWQTLRRRAGVSDDIDATIAATDMAREAENDWAAYSAGAVLADKTLYNIRRERRAEFLSEGFRMDDLKRWRALDQLIARPYIIEGIHLWNTPMQHWYDKADGTSALVYGTDKANVSAPTDSEYLRPFRKKSSQLGYDGFTWHMAHYLSPIRIDQLLITSPDGATASASPIWQNPYWPTEADKAAEQ